MTDREAFERWLEQRPSLSNEKYSGGQYCDWDTQAAWTAWQAACKYKDETPSKIDALRGQLQNCANLLHRLKRLGRAGDATAADAAIDSANRVLHETLCK